MIDRQHAVVNQLKENLFGVAIRCGQDLPDEYGKKEGQDIKRGDAHYAPIFETEGESLIYQSND